MLKKIVITGAPGTGKTVVIRAIEKLGYPCYHEIIRDMTAAAKEKGTAAKQVTNPLIFVDDPLEFNTKLLRGRESHFDISLKSKDPICFFDRGMPDVLAYMHYFKQEYPKAFWTTCVQKRYDRIFIMPPWEAIYTADNERLENFKEAEALHLYLMDTYQSLGYRPEIVPKVSIAERVDFILKNTI